MTVSSVHDRVAVGIFASGAYRFQDHSLPRKSVVAEAELHKESLKSPSNSSTGMFDLARGALRTIPFFSSCFNLQELMIAIARQLTVSDGPSSSNYILARSFFRTKSKVVPEIVEFDEVCMP